MSRHRIRASTEFSQRRPGVRELKIALCTCGSLAKTALFIQASWSFNLLNLLVTNQHFNIQLHAVRTDSWGGSSTCYLLDTSSGSCLAEQELTHILACLLDA